MSVRATAVRSREIRSTRDAILDAAERQFAERGFAGVSVREIAAESGLKNQASLYHHFRNKRALYEAVLGRGAEAILELIVESARAGAAGNAERGIDAFLDRILDYLTEHPELPRLIQRAGLDGSRHLRSTATRFLRPLYDQGLRELASRRGPWQAAELPHVATGIYHLIFGYFANAPLLAGILQADLGGPAAVTRQRRFLKKAVAALLGVGRARVVAATKRPPP